MAIRKMMRVPVTAALLVAGSSTALALTGDEVLNKMEPRESGGYLAGTVEMAAFVSHAAGNKARSACIMDWYYKKNGVEELVAALTRYKDRQALPVIHLIVNRACGE